MGHLTRATALARAAVRGSTANGRRRPKTHISLLTNSPFARQISFETELGPEHRIVSLAPDLGRDETVARVKEVFKATPFDLLVVDTFPRGLGGELADLLPALACPKVLVHRDLNPRYIRECDVSKSVNWFDRLLVPGESSPFGSASHAVRTAPWLIRDAHELLSPFEARRVLDVESDTLPVVAVIGSGRAQEVEQMDRLAGRLASEFGSRAAVRFVALRARNVVERGRPPENAGRISNLWPFLQAIRGVSVSVGNGGYNTVHEARVTQTPLVALARPRLYDRQERRLTEKEVVSGFQAVRNRVAAAIAPTSSGLTESPPQYENGVYAAIDILDRLSPPPM